MPTTTFKPKKLAPASPFSKSAKNKGAISEQDASVGNIDKSGGDHPIDKTGIKIRGTGAATKGITARGPMG